MLVHVGVVSIVGIVGVGGVGGVGSDDGVVVSLHMCTCINTHQRAFAFSGRYFTQIPAKKISRRPLMISVL